MSVIKELCTTLGISPEEGETEQDFGHRAALKANKLDDAGWESLSEEAQQWVNSGLEALEKKEALPPLEGWGKDDESLSESSSGEGEQGDPPEEGKSVAAKAKDKPSKPVRTKKSNGNAASRGRPGKWSDDSKITIAADKNPHREGSKDYNKFKTVKNGMTIAKARENGVESSYLRYGVEKGYFTVS